MGITLASCLGRSAMTPASYACSIISATPCAKHFDEVALSIDANSEACTSIDDLRRQDARRHREMSGTCSTVRPSTWCERKRWSTLSCSRASCQRRQNPLLSAAKATRRSSGRDIPRWPGSWRCAALGTRRALTAAEGNGAESSAVWESIWWAVSVESAATEWRADGRMASMGRLVQVFWHCAPRGRLHDTCSKSCDGCSVCPLCLLVARHARVDMCPGERVQSYMCNRTSRISPVRHLL